jgi:hypothetical protein
MGVGKWLVVSAFCFLAMGCSQDPRDARVLVVSPGLQESTQQAIDFWKSAAPGQLDIEIANRCDFGGYQCITVQWQDLSNPKLAGVCHRHWYYDYRGQNRSSEIGISPRVADDPAFLNRVVSHEMGHAFTLEHVSTERDIMFPKSGFCITKATSDQWYSAFGAPLKQVCLPDN